MKKDFDIADIEYEFLSSKRVLDSFKCADTKESAEIEQFLREKALFFHQQGLAKTVLALWENTIVGYFSLAMGQIQLTAGVKIEAFGEEISIIRIPALLLARMGVHEGYRGKDIGTAMMSQVFDIADEISKRMGCRFIYVDAKFQAIEFYKKFDFEENHHKSYKNRDKSINMILDLTKIKADL